MCIVAMDTRCLTAASAVFINQNNNITLFRIQTKLLETKQIIKLKLSRNSDI